MRVTRMDHLVLTVANLDITTDFYQRVLGMKPQLFAGDRIALNFGDQKINLHTAGGEFEPKARVAAPGSADLCFIVNEPLAIVIDHLNALQVPIELGPVQRTGATGMLNSLYIRDPDGNLLELSEYRV
ncbi:MULTISPECIES: VOC family protein [Shewanella]|uniref:VOC family protein n=1 Tax=Shewanella salipaludis TaxID=2723052 RepID=A0A972JKL2_9GAMM|nr:MULTISPECIES: VOC family protein [Shewanella]MCE9685031.1 VOC family protein [Shewanella sp. AS16]NMH64492.1 VOC family protein [Shewanella salipaludis]